MGTLGKIARGTLVAASGALAVLAGIKVADDRKVNRIWQTLAGLPAPGGVFSLGLVADLPEPARRYFLHAIRPGADLATRLHWQYTGTMRPGPQMPEMALTVDQILVAQRGFVWKAFARNGPLVMTAADHYLDGDARMRIALYGLVPVVNASGPDIARSSLGRLLVESIAIPASMLPGPNVQIEGVDDSHFRVIVNVRGEMTPITVAVDQKGRARELTMPRWGNQTEDGHFEYIPYGAALEQEQQFGAYTIPSRIRVAWWYGTDRYLEQIALTVHAAQFE